MVPRLATFVDFMAYARKLDNWMKRENLQTFGEFMNSLWKSFKRYAKDSERLDIVFDNYLSSSVKAGERARRSHQLAGMRTIITYIDQPLPPKSELAKFWAHNENKIHLQQFFITWLAKISTQKFQFISEAVTKTICMVAIDSLVAAKMK